MTVTDTWRELLLDAERMYGQSASLVRRLVPESEQDLFLALRPPSDSPVLLLNVPRQAASAASELPMGTGFSLTVADAVFGRERQVTYTLELVDDRYRDIFFVLLEDVVGRVALQGEPAAMVRALLARLRAWQRFMAEHSRGGLSAPARQGLYGELWVLRDALLPITGPAMAVNAWTGPDARRHDFQLDSCSIEVKTSASSPPQMIRVNGERQLDESLVTCLWLYHLSLEVSQTGHESLPMMVEAVRELLAPDDLARQVFDDHLLTAGYLDADAERYREPCYGVRSDDIFRVTEGFPCIREHDLPTGVGDVSYSVILDCCAPYQVSRSEFDQSLR